MSVIVVVESSKFGEFHSGLVIRNIPIAFEECLSTYVNFATLAEDTSETTIVGNCGQRRQSTRNADATKYKSSIGSTFNIRLEHIVEEYLKKYNISNKFTVTQKYLSTETNRIINPYCDNTVIVHCTQNDLKKEPSEKPFYNIYFSDHESERNIDINKEIEILPIYNHKSAFKYAGIML